MDNGNLNMISHYCQNWILKGRALLWDNNPNEADHFRAELCQKLEDLHDPLADQLVSLLKQHDWKTASNIDDFNHQYTTLKQEYKENNSSK